MRTPGPKTLIPDAVLIKSTGEEIEVRDHPVMEALVAAIGEDFMEPTAGGVTDVVSAAANAKITLEVLEHAGLKAVDKDAIVASYEGADGEPLAGSVTIRPTNSQEDR